MTRRWRRIEWQGSRRRARSDRDDERSCKICLDSELQVVLLPCRHMCMCVACSKKKVWKACPMCQGDIVQMIEVFK